MKNSLYLFVVIVTFSFACNNNPKGNVEIVDEEVMEEIPTFSEVDFDKAIAAYSAGKYKEAAKHIIAAIKDLETESKDLPKEAKDQVNKSLTILRNIEAKIEKGEIVNVEEMKKAFMQAETSLAHDYFFVSSIYSTGQPAKAKKSLDKAVKRLKYAVKRLDGKAKEKGEELLKKGKALQANDTELAEEWEAEAKNLVKEINEWRKSHQSELFYNHPSGFNPYYYY